MMGILSYFDKNHEVDSVSSEHLFIKGMDSFYFTLDVVPKMTTDVLEKNKLQMEDIDLFIFHQANKYMLGFLRKKIKIPEEKFLENTGNTVSSTVPICLCEVEKQGKLKGKVLLSGFGVGLSWASCVVERK